MEENTLLLELKTNWGVSEGVERHLIAYNHPEKQGKYKKWVPITPNSVEIRPDPACYGNTKRIKIK